MYIYIYIYIYTQLLSLSLSLSHIYIYIYIYIYIFNYDYNLILKVFLISEILCYCEFKREKLSLSLSDHENMLLTIAICLNSNIYNTLCWWAMYRRLNIIQENQIIHYKNSPRLLKKGEKHYRQCFEEKLCILVLGDDSKLFKELRFFSKYWHLNKFCCIFYSQINLPKSLQIWSQKALGWMRIKRKRRRVFPFPSWSDNIKHLSRILQSIWWSCWHDVCETWSYGQYIKLVVVGGHLLNLYILCARAHTHTHTDIWIFN